MNKLQVLLITIIAIIAKSEQKFIIPDIQIQALKPKGLIVSMPDSIGVQQFAFHANINHEIRGKEDGTISREVGYAQNGIWEIRDSEVQLKVGDEIYYWIFVQHKRLGFDRQEQYFKVTELIDADSVPKVPPPTCQPSITEVNGQKQCANIKMFEDTFDNFDENKWVKEQYVPWGPDFEFNTYENTPQNNYISNGNLILKATLRDGPIADIDLSNGCTGQNCTLSVVGTIVPPVIGARVKSKFSFKYGRIEIRAQLPRGDWLYPQLYLEPRDYSYGEGYSSGRMWLAYARGNQDLRSGKTGDQIGNNVLYSGAVLSDDEPQRTYKAYKISKTFGQSWGSDYHTYTLLWQPDGLRVSVDNENTKDILPPYAHPDSPYKSSWVSSNAPFDKDFVISLGIGAGGVSDFPDGSTSNGAKKPWKRTSAKRPLLFYNAKDTWLPTWSGDKSQLKIDYIRIWSI